MAIQVAWDSDDKQVVRFTAQGDWTIEDGWQALERAEALLNEVDYVPDVINDIRNMGSSPLNALTFWQAVLDWVRERDLQQTIVILVGGGWFIRTAGRSLNNLNIPMLQRMRFAKDLPAARYELRKYRRQHPRQQRQTE